MKPYTTHHYACDGCEAAFQETTSLLKDAEKAIDALIVFGHQHTTSPLLKEMAVLLRIKMHLQKTLPQPEP
jgi:hypothetical protein